MANPDPNLSPDMIELTLPYPPSVNHLYRRVGNRVLISREGRKFRDQVGLFIAFAGHPRFECPVKIDVELYPPDRRTRDIDNITKGLFDALQNGGMLSNDSIICEFNVKRCEMVANGMCIVRVRKAKGDTNG